MSVDFGSLGEWTPVAIVIGAGIAALYATKNHRETLEDGQKRLRRQLNAENVRHRRQLKDERDRLERQLEHDRDMRDRDELRRTLDELAQLLIAASDQSDYAIVRLRTFHRRLKEEAEEPLVDAARKNLSESTDKLFSRTTVLASAYGRLAIRLSPSDAIQEEFWNARTKLVELRQAVRAACNGQPSEEDVEAIEAKWKVASRAYWAFLRVCRERFEVEGSPDLLD